MNKGEKSEADLSQDLVERVEVAMWKAVYEPPMKADLRDAHAAIKLQIRALAKAAIAAMPLRSADLSDAKGQEESPSLASGSAKEFGVGVPGAAPDSPIDLVRLKEALAFREDGFTPWNDEKELFIAAARAYMEILQHRADGILPAWIEDGFKAACADMAAQIQSAKNGGGEELLAKNVCVSSLCVAYKDAAIGEGK